MKELNHYIVVKCAKCLSSPNYQYLFNICKLMYESIFGDMNIEIDIILIITKYSLDKIIKGQNQTRECYEAIESEVEVKKMWYM